jgi:hypothetical protein
MQSNHASLSYVYEALKDAGMEDRTVKSATNVREYGGTIAGLLKRTYKENRSQCLEAGEAKEEASFLSVT